MSYHKNKWLYDGDYQPWVIQALIEHINEGWSVPSFKGRYKIPEATFNHWRRKHPELDRVVKQYYARPRTRSMMSQACSRPKSD